MVKYQEIAKKIRNKIINKEYQEGQKLPYEYELCQLYSCNKETMKKALALLVKEGLIVRRRGSGTYVKANAKIEKASERGNLRLVVFEMVNADAALAQKLQVAIGDQVYHIEVIRSVDKQPVALEIRYLPLEIITNLTKSYITTSFYRYIEDTLKLKIQSLHKKITGHLATSLEQEYLGLKKEETYFQIEQIGYLSNGKIFEYALLRYHYRYFELHTVTIM